VKRKGRLIAGEKQIKKRSEGEVELKKGLNRRGKDLKNEYNSNVGTI